MKLKRHMHTPCRHFYNHDPIKGILMSPTSGQPPRYLQGTTFLKTVEKESILLHI